MSRTSLEAIVGAAVLAVAVGFAVYAAQAGGFARRAGGYPLTASFRSLEGVNVGTDVRLAGVRIGSVTEVALNGETYRADTRLSVREDVQIPDDSSAVIASEGLLGGSYVEIRPGGSLFALEPGEEIVDTQGAVSLVQLLLRYVGGSGE